MKTRTFTPQTNHITNLHSFITACHSLKTDEYIHGFTQFIDGLKTEKAFSYCRKVISPPGREVIVWDTQLHSQRTMLMFAANNYLGLANDPYVNKQVCKAIDRYGTGLSGPPLLNGYTALMEETEERLALLKHQESAMIFSSGYGANLGLITALAQDNDHILYDELSHASFYDGIRMSGAPATRFEHNNLHDLESKLDLLSSSTSDTVFLGIEGVYSMDGDLAPLDQIMPIAKRKGAFTILDDAHGTGVLGESGSGTAEHFGVAQAIDLHMGTFSKSFAMTGGFLAGNRELIDYLRFFARSYMFSAALTTPTLAAVLAGIDIIEQEPERRSKLMQNSRYAIQKLSQFGIVSRPEAAIIALRIPEWMDIRKANLFIHEQGIFLNAIEYPAVPEGQERFRISISSLHSEKDIDRLAAVLDSTWNNSELRKTSS